MVEGFDFDSDGGLNCDEFSDMVSTYFERQTAKDTWSKVTLKRKTPEMRRFKLFSMGVKNLRTVEDDDDAHSSCVASSIFTASHTLGDSRLADSSSSSESSGGDEAPPHRGLQ